MKYIAVTGSSGFVGSHLIKRLRSLNKEFCEIDVKSGIDLMDSSRLLTLPPLNHIIHTAAKIFVPDSLINPANFIDFNVKTTLNALELARKHSAKFAFISSYLYGEPEYIPVDEKHPLKPHNPYGYSKLICEKLVEMYHKLYKLDTIILRPFNLYGQGQHNSFVIPKIIRQMKTGEIILDDPRPKRDFLFIDDFIELLTVILNKGYNGYCIYNVGSGYSISIEEVANTIMQQTESKVTLNFTNNYRDHEIMNSVADISKISNQFEWKPLTNFRDGILTILKKEYSGCS